MDMKEEKVKKLQEQFKKTYLDTVKHANDIEKWINSGKRKQGDIRRSIERLESKYKTLLEIRKGLINQNSDKYIYLNRVENELEFNKLENQLSQKTEMTMDQIKEKIQNLYKSAKIQLPQKYNNSMEEYNKIELVTDIQGNEKGLYYLEKRKKSLMKRKEHHRRKIFNIKELIIDKYYYIKHRLENRKNEKNRKYKKVGRISALFMAGTLALFGGTTVGESNTDTVKNEKNEKSYVDINKENNEFKESLFVQALEETTNPNTVQETTVKMAKQKETWNTQPTFVQPTTEATEVKKENNINKNQSTKKEEKIQNQQDNKTTEYKESADDVYILKANTEYTENSLGEGTTGFVSRDTKVNIYNRALVKTDKQGNKSILKVTKVGQTWEEYAKDQGIDYKEFKTYIENNPNIKEMVSLDDVDGNQLGWISKDKLEKVEEIER